MTYLKLTLGQEGEDIIARTEQFAGKLAAALNSAYLAGAGGPYNPLVDVKLELPRFVLRALNATTGTGLIAERTMKYPRWSESIPDPDSARRRPRP